MPNRTLRHFRHATLAILAMMSSSPSLAHETNPVDEAVAEWLAAINAGDHDAGRAAFADDAVVVGPAGPIAFGRAEVDASVAYLTSTPGFRVEFTPERSGLSIDGQTGFVVGDSVIHVPGPNGTRVPQRQRLLLVWRKEPSGQWKCIYNVPMGVASLLPTEGPQDAAHDQPPSAAN